MRIDDPTAYVIWSIEHMAWWRPASMGYTTSLHEAGRYTKAEGEDILSRANLVAFHECLIPVSAIGAAPELLAALRIALEYFDSDPVSDCEPGCGCFLHPMRAAIAKAEGQP